MAGTAAGGARRNPIAPYLLVAPGVLWLLAFYVIPIAHAGADLGRAGGTRLVRRLPAGLHRLRRALLPVVRLRAGRHAARRSLLGYPLAYVIAFRAGGSRTSCSASSSCRSSPPSWCAPSPGRPSSMTAGRRSGCCERCTCCRRGRTAAQHLDRGDRRADLQLPAVHDPADLRQPGEDRPAAHGGGAGSLLQRRSRPSARWSCRCRSRASSPAACSPSFPPRATSSTPSCWGAPTRR